MKWIMISLCLCLQTAWAHKPSDSYLMLDIDQNRIAGQWDIALRDLDFAIGLDMDDNGSISWGELRQRKEAVYAYAFSRLQLQGQQSSCEIRPMDLLVDSHSDGRYAVLQFNVDCPVQQYLTLTYRLFFDLDAQHRGLLKLSQPNGTVSNVFSPAHDSYSLTSVSVGSAWHELLNFAREGVWHIWIGYDHMLFLLSLLLPSALHRNALGWQLKPDISKTCWDVFAVVTAFTLAHSLTLSLAALGYIALPSNWVESAIAVSVALAAANNLYPLLTHRRAWLAFGFGLIHGMGIASVLLDLQLPASLQLLSLLGFNLGVEVGQLAIVGLALPLIILCSRYRFYPQWILQGGSAGIVMMALLWLAERSLDFELNIF